MKHPPAWTVPGDLATPSGPYSLCSVTPDGWIHTAGLVAMDGAGQTIGPDDVGVQTQAIFDQARHVLHSAGASLADITFAHVFLKDLADYANMNQAYRRAFADDLHPLPPRYCIRADLIKPELLVEFAFVAKRRP